MEIPPLVLDNYPNPDELKLVSSHIWQTSQALDQGEKIGGMFFGPSGVGKDTILAELLKLYPEDFEFLRTSTTRPPRNASDVNYNFLNQAEFNKLKSKDGFLETIVYGGNEYGTTRSEFERIGVTHRAAIIRIDGEGVERLKQIKRDGDPTLANWRLVSFFITTSTMEELKERLYGRSSKEEADRRLSLASAELAGMQMANYIVVNERDQQGVVAKEIREIIKKLRTS